jgi:hypothetical protein
MKSNGIQVGDTVRFHFGSHAIVGRVIEDRGPIGVGGRRLYGISYDLGADHPYYVELPAADIEVIEPVKDRR